MTFKSDIQMTAEREIRDEQFRAAVEREKARLRSHSPFWDRVAKIIPFTITRKTK